MIALQFFAAWTLSYAVYYAYTRYMDRWIRQVQARRKK